MLATVEPGKTGTRVYIMRNYFLSYRRLTMMCSAWFGHIHLPVGNTVSGGFKQSIWKRRGQ